jgi:hypothetical protein
MLIERYNDNNVSDNSYAHILHLMIAKSEKPKEGLTDEQIKNIIVRTVNIFCLRSKDTTYLKLLITLQKDLLLKTINNTNYQEYYIKRVKTLKDEWFYGDVIFKYLNDYLRTTNPKYPTFKSRIALVKDTFIITEQVDFIEKLFDSNNDFILYNWFKSFYRVVSKQVFDVYLRNLIIAHKNDVVLNNNFLEWIVKVPKSFFYKKTKDSYLVYLNSLTISHKTYNHKKEKAIKYLTD